jgi:anti-sigma factor RsiW
MNCDQFADSLTAFSLGELPAAEAAEARGHLETCARCNTLTLRDRQLVSMLRFSAVPAPASLHQAVHQAVRQAGRRRSARRPWYRAPRWLAAGLAALFTLGALTAVLVVRPQEPTEPPALLAAWDAYHEDTLPLEERADLAGDPAAAQDLTAAGLQAVDAGQLTLEGTPASAAEYRGPGEQRLVVFNWSGDLPDLDAEDGGYPGVRISTWGPHRSAWWEGHGSVYCAVGNLDEDAFMLAVQSLRQG